MSNTWTSASTPPPLNSIVLVTDGEHVSTALYAKDDSPIGDGGCHYSLAHVIGFEWAWVMEGDGKVKAWMEVPEVTKGII